MEGETKKWTDEDIKKLLVEEIDNLRTEISSKELIVRQEIEKSVSSEVVPMIMKIEELRQVLVFKEKQLARKNHD
jgi:hypothetical protein